MTHQERKTPESDAEFLTALELCGGSQAEMSRMYEVHESSVRKRLARIRETEALRKATDSMRQCLIQSGMSVDEAFSYEAKRVKGARNYVR